MMQLFQPIYPVPRRKSFKSKLGTINKWFSLVDYVSSKSKLLLSLLSYKFPLNYDECTETVGIRTLHFIRKSHVNKYAHINPVETDHYVDVK